MLFIVFWIIAIVITLLFFKGLNRCVSKEEILSNDYMQSKEQSRKI